MMKNGVYFIVIAFLFAELFKILVYFYYFFLIYFGVMQIR